MCKRFILGVEVGTMWHTNLVKKMDAKKRKIPDERLRGWIFEKRPLHSCHEIDVVKGTAYVLPLVACV